MHGDPGEARGVLRDHEGGEALGAGRRSRASEHDVETSDRRVGDEALRAREHPVVVTKLGARREGGGVRARPRLGQRERGNGLASGQRWEPASLLSLCAREEDGVAPQPLDRKQLLGGRACPGELLAYEAEGHRPERALEASSVGCGHEPGEETLATEGSCEIPVELVALSPRLGEGTERLGGRPGHRGPKGLLLRRKVEAVTQRHGSLTGGAAIARPSSPTYVSNTRPSPSAVTGPTAARTSRRCERRDRLHRGRGRGPRWRGCREAESR